MLNILIYIVFILFAAMALGIATGDIYNSFYSIFSGIWVIFKAALAFGLISAAVIIFSDSTKGKEAKENNRKSKFFGGVSIIVLASLGILLAINVLGNAIDGGVYCDTPLCR